MSSDNEPLGLIFDLDERSGELSHNSFVAMTKEDAETMVLAKNQLDQFLKYSCHHNNSPRYWVPLSAFQPLMKTPAKPLTPEISYGTLTAKHNQRHAVENSASDCE